MTNSINEIGDAACIFAIGTNTTENHPIIGLQIKKAVQNKTQLIVANPRKIDLCRYATLWLQHHPGTDVALLMGMMRVIVDEGLLDSSFIKQRTEDFDTLKESLQNFDLDLVEKITGVPTKQIQEAARIYATQKPATILYCMGITQHSHGTENVMALSNLALLTGNIGTASSGVNPLRGQNNVQGACDLGSLPNVFTGYQQVANDEARVKFEKAWDVTGLPAQVGLALTEMLPAAEHGDLKALYIMGENPMVSDPDLKHVEKSLDNLEFLVVQDIFLTETAQMADVVLPAASFAEKDGTFTNTERRVQRVRKGVKPPGKARADWEIIADLSTRMGYEMRYRSAEEIFEEIAELTPSYAGISYQRLDKEGGLQWPCPTPKHPGTPYLHKDKFVRGKGKFIPLEYKPSAEVPDKKYPFILTTQRSLYHYHTGTMTRKVEGLNVLRRSELVEINPKDAEALGVSDGEMVQVKSRRGLVTAKAKVTEDSPPGVVSMTFHFAESPTNMLTNPIVDPTAKTPELKVCAVKVEKL